MIGSQFDPSAALPGVRRAGQGGGVDQGGRLMPWSFSMLLVGLQAVQWAIYMQNYWIVLSTLVRLRDRTDTAVSAGFGSAGVWKPLSFERSRIHHLIFRSYAWFSSGFAGY
jgi:hypothetical protein